MRFTKILVLVAIAALVIAPAALALRFTDDSFNTPTGETGKAYSFQFHGAGGCGPALPYQYKVLAGSLPTGLSLSSSGLISGTPSLGGGWSFWVELSDENPPSASWCVPSSAQREFSISVVQGLTIKQNALSPKATFLNEPYSFQLSADGGGTQVWSLKSGSLPAGMSVNPNGLVSGTPTATGDFTFVVQVTDTNRTDTETFTLTVVERLKITAPPSPSAEVGVPLALALKSTGGRPAVTWSLLGGSLPTGLALNPATGEISGTPAVAGAYPLKVQVADTLGLTATVDVPLTVAAKLAVVKKPLPAAKVGKLYQAKLRATGGVTPLKWNILGGKPGFLPTGIKFNAKTGAFSGTPKKAGVYRLRMQVVDKLGVKSALGIVLKVQA
jgi:putative Ig domain-containing protein